MGDRLIHISQWTGTQEALSTYIKTHLLNDSCYTVTGNKTTQRLQTSRYFIFISIVKPTRCTLSQIDFILEQHSACFGRSFRPSSGV